MSEIEAWLSSLSDKERRSIAEAGVAVAQIEHRAIWDAAQAALREPSPCGVDGHTMMDCTKFRNCSCDSPCNCLDAGDFVCAACDRERKTLDRGFEMGKRVASKHFRKFWERLCELEPGLRQLDLTAEKMVLEILSLPMPEEPTHTPTGP
jgi:hypothetical protein